jgi:hypothetical protein
MVPQGDPEEVSTGRGQGLDLERMNVRFHQITERRVDLTMACERWNATECIGHDAHAKVTVAAGRASVAGVLVTLVLDD